mgnify:CR=1 FL=1
MTTPSNTRIKKESGFGSFAFGVAVGVGAALLLGTEEGRKFTSKLLDTLKDNLPKPESDNRSVALAQGSESTPHHTTYEAKPPSYL